MHRLVLAAIGLCLAANGAFADGHAAVPAAKLPAAKLPVAKPPAAKLPVPKPPAAKPAAATTPTPMQLVQQRAAQEKLNRQARLAARKPSPVLQPQTFSPVVAIAVQPAIQRSDAPSPQRVVPSAKVSQSVAKPVVAPPKPTPQELVQQRAAQELVNRQLRLAARWQSQLPQPRVYYPGEGLPAQPMRPRIDYEFPLRAAQSMNGARYIR